MQTWGDVLFHETVVAFLPGDFLQEQQQTSQDIQMLPPSLSLAIEMV